MATLSLAQNTEYWKNIYLLLPSNIINGIKPKQYPQSVVFFFKVLASYLTNTTARTQQLRGTAVYH